MAEYTMIYKALGMCFARARAMRSSIDEKIMLMVSKLLPAETEWVTESETVERASGIEMSVSGEVNDATEAGGGPL